MVVPFSGVKFCEAAVFTVVVEGAGCDEGILLVFLGNWWVATSGLAGGLGSGVLLAWERGTTSAS